MNELVSIIIPCYNGEKFIERAINSVMMQDYDNIELIVVDDGSTDNSKGVILKLKEAFDTDNRVLKYIYQSNLGLGAAINTGLKHVTGRYLSLLDADDEYLQGCVRERVEYLHSNDEIALVRSNGYIVDGDNKRLFVNDESEKNNKSIFDDLVCGRTNNWAGSYMLRTDMLFDFYPDRNIYISRYGQNLQLMLPASYKRECRFIDKPHMNYIHQTYSLSQAQDKKQKLKKEVENCYGYTDIRKHMVNIIIKDNSEKSYYLNIIQENCILSLYSIAISYNEIGLLKKFYRETDHKSINTKIVYYNYIFKPYSLFLRLIRKIFRVN
ncbi:MAG: glycosyltransferase family 2 protein [Clostridia bacterium]|nr:glycosyltransferase family 2 protein [Clostridia bacterium]